MGEKLSQPLMPEDLVVCDEFGFPCYDSGMVAGVISPEAAEAIREYCGELRNMEPGWEQRAEEANIKFKELAGFSAEAVMEAINAQGREWFPHREEYR